MQRSDRMLSKKSMNVVLAMASIAMLASLMVPAHSLVQGFAGSSMGTITGIVTDAETGEPIANALVTLKYHDVIRVERTSAQGRYTFTNVPMCFCLKNVTASKIGYESETQMVAVQKVTTVNFSLSPNGGGDDPNTGVLTGVVTDAETDDPIPEVLMTLKYHEEVRTEYTDSEGQYTFEDVPICYCQKNISASKDGYEGQYQLVGVDELTYANFSLEPIEGPDEPEEGVLTGVVTDAETGEPIPGALVTLEYHELVRTQLTDEDGRYTFTDVPICFCLKDVSVSKSGYEDRHASVGVSEMTTLDFALEPIEPENDRSETANGETRPIGSTAYYYALTGLVGLLLVIAMIGVFMIARKR